MIMFLSKYVVLFAIIWVILFVGIFLFVMIKTPRRRFDIINNSPCNYEHHSMYKGGWINASSLYLSYDNANKLGIKLNSMGFEAISIQTDGGFVVLKRNEITKMKELNKKKSLPPPPVSQDYGY